MIEAITYRYACKVIRVIDGDTVVCEIDLGFHLRAVKAVRLAGINAKGLRGGTLEERAMGAKAAARLTELARLEHNGSVKTKLDPFDKYGRVLGWLTLGGLNINQLLAEEGLAEKLP